MFSTMLGLLHSTRTAAVKFFHVWEMYLQLTKNVQLPLPSRQYDVDNQQ